MYYMQLTAKKMGIGISCRQINHQDLKMCGVKNLKNYTTNTFLEGKYIRKIKAREIAIEWFKTVVQAGNPYITFKDHVNAKC